MQVKNNASIEIGKKKKWLFSLLKAVISLLCIYFIYDQFRDRQIPSILDLPNYFIPVLTLQFLLMVLNWSLEIYRWKISIESSEKISLQQASVDVLGGLTLNWVVPFTVGDYVARIVAKKNRFEATSAIVLNRTIMLLLTGLVGAFGLLTFFNQEINALQILAGLFFIAVAFLAANKLAKGRLFKYFIHVERKTLWRVIFLSVIRYGVFFFQFVILLKIFNPELSLRIISLGIGWIFLVRTSIPSLLGGLGLREASAFLFFENIVTDASTVVFPVFILWLVNTVIPSLIGALLIWRFKAYNSKDSHNIA